MSRSVRCCVVGIDRGVLFGVLASAFALVCFVWLGHGLLRIVLGLGIVVL